MQGKKPSREERKILEANGLDTYTWLVQKSNIKYIQVVNKETGEIRKIDKE